MTSRPSPAQLGWMALIVAGCAAHAAFRPQPMQLRLDVIERSLRSVETRALPRPDGGDVSPPLELQRALHASYDAVDDARSAVKARETGDGRAVDEKIRILRQRLETLDGILASAGISITPGLDVLATTEDDRPDAGAGVR
jgi:hypothetical protein